MLPHSYTAIDYIAVVAAGLVGIVTLCAGLLRVVGPPWGQAARSRRVGILPLAAGAVTVFLTTAALVDYASWDGNTLPPRFSSSALRVLAAFGLVFASGLALRWSRREGQRSPEGARHRGSG